MKVDKRNKIEITNLYLYKVGDIVRHKVYTRLIGEIIKRHRSTLSNWYIVKSGEFTALYLEDALYQDECTNRMEKLKEIGI